MKYCIIYDLETTGLDIQEDARQILKRLEKQLCPNTAYSSTDLIKLVSAPQYQELQIVQIAAVPMNLKTLEMETDRVFNINVKPDGVDNHDFSDAHKQVLNFHSKNTSKTHEEIINIWKAGFAKKEALRMFCDYCAEFKDGSKPTAGGQNIILYDNPIIKRDCDETGNKYPFAQGQELDLRYIAPTWLQFSKRPPYNYSLDSLRKYFGIPTEGGHEALKDVLDCGDLIKRFLTLQKRVISKVPEFCK